MGNFNLKDFKRENALRGKDVVTMLAREYPKFTKACETAATYPEQYGVQLSPAAVNVLKGKFPDKRKAKPDKRDMLQLRCRVTPELNGRFKHQLCRKGQTAQEVLTELLTVWVEAFENEEKKTASGTEAPKAADENTITIKIAQGGRNVKTIRL